MIPNTNFKAKAFDQKGHFANYDKFGKYEVRL